MFQNCFLHELDLSNLYAPNLTSIGSFIRNGSAYNLNLDNWYVPNLTAIGGMFYNSSFSNVSLQTYNSLFNLLVNLAPQISIKNLSNYNSYSPFYNTRFFNYIKANFTTEQKTILQSVGYEGL